MIMMTEQRGGSRSAGGEISVSFRERTQGFTPRSGIASLRDRSHGSH
jgi:hypothetical protein